MVKKVFLLLILNLIMIGDSFSQGVIIGPNPSCGTRNILYCYSGPCTCGTWQEAAPATGNVTFGTPVGNCIDVSFTATGTYNIEYVIGSGCGCTAGNVISLQVDATGAPNPSFTTFDFCENSKNKVAYYDSGLFVFDPDPLDGSTIDPITGVITGGVAGSSYTIKHLVGQLPCADSLNLTINCIASSDPLCSSSGCNVVSNGGFDVYNQCPNGLGQVPRSNDWYDGAFGSADYYNTVCGYTVNSSGSLVLPQPPPSLGGAVGFYVNHTSGYYKEDIGQKVELCQGQKYSFEIAFAANASGQLNTILNDAAIYVGNANLFPVNYDPTTRCPIGFQQIVTIPTTGATPTWNTYTTTFTATQNTDALILGASCAGSYSTSGYMFFDDIAIRPIDTATLSVNNNAPCQGDSVQLIINIPGGCYGPYDVTITDGTSTFNLTGLSSGGTYTVLPNGATTYTITSISNSFGCTNTVNSTVQVTPITCVTSDSCNLVLNGGFENFNLCPDSLGQIPRASNWQYGSFGSSDFYHTCGFTSASGGILTPPQPYPSPLGVVGIYLSEPTSYGAGYYKEDVGQMIDMCIGQKYEFEIKYAPNSGFAYPIVNNASIFLGNSGGLPVPFDPVTLCPQGFQQAITIPTMGAPLGWSTYTTTFTATQNSNTFILGADCSLGPINSGRSYVYFDDIVLRPIDTVTLSASTISVCPNEPFMTNFLIPGGCYGPYDIIYTKNGVLDTAFGVNNNDPLIDSVTVNTVYLLQEIINANGCSSPLNAPLTVTITNQSTTSMLAYDFCAGDSNQIVINGNQTGTFSFTSLPSGGETINSNTGLISGATANNTYYIQYELTGACPDTLYDTITALPCDDTCELVFNGDFEMGNVGFTSPSQQFTSTNCFNDGFYSVAQSLDTCFNGTWVLGKDHTTGNGKFLAVNLNDNTSVAPNAYAYCVSINTQPGEQYSYCMWVANIFDTVTAYAPNPPTVQFELDGSLLGTSFVVPAGGDWYQHGGLFTATTTNSNFCIKQPLPHNGLPGMDVAFDDISVKKVADSVLIGLDKDTVYCNGDSVTLDIKVFGCPIEYAYEVKMPGLDTVFYVLDSMKYTFFVDSSISIEVNSANCQFQWDTILNIWAVSDTADFTFDDFCVGDTQIIQMLGTPGGTFSFNPNPMDGATVDPLTGVISNEVGGSLYGIKYITPSGCDSISVQVAVNNIDTAILSGGGDICDGVAETITVNFTGTPPWSFTYTDGVSIYTVSNVLTSPYAFNVNDTGTYEIVAFSNVNCDGYYSGQAIITGDSLDFEADVYAGCSPLAVNFNHLVNLPSGGNCTWNFGNGQSFNNCTGVSSVYNSPGCFDVTLTVSSANCSAKKTIADMICVYDNPEADFSVSPQPLTVYQNVAQLNNQSNGATSYQWFINGVVISNNVNVSYPFPSDTGTHEICLVAINDFGCVDTTCKTVNVYEEISIFVPNSFTPDGDGRNDVFQPVTIGLETYELFIFDRWGELIYTTQKPENNWDGKHEGEPVKTDVYVWKIVYTAPNVSGKKTLHGHVSVLR